MIHSIVDMPDQLFFVINFSFAIVFSVMGCLVSLLTLSIFIFNKTYRTVNTLLICNTNIICLMYCVNNIVVSIYGYREDSAFGQPACSFRAYWFIVSCMCICYSYLMQAISRLFFAVFFKYKSLVTFRTHFHLIALNWILGIILSIAPFFLDNGYVLERESRLCTATTKNFWSALYVIGIGFLVPVLISATLYGIILYRAYQSTRRVFLARANAVDSQMPNARREIKIITNMIIIMTVFVSGGVPFLILVFWHIIQPAQPPPSSLYLLSNNTISFAVTLTTIVMFLLNQQMKNAVLGYLGGRFRPVHPMNTIAQPSRANTRN